MITLTPIAYVRAERLVPDDDDWGGSEASVVLTELAEGKARTCHE
jgi:hypothetical protein